MARVFSSEDFINEGVIPPISKRTFSSDDFIEETPTSLTTAQNITGGLRTALQGLTLGAADEIEGGVAGVSSLLQGQDYLTGYKQGREEARQSVKDFKEVNPVLGTISEVGGSFLSPGGAAKSLIGKVLQESAKAGVTGYLSGEESEQSRSDQAVNSGILGGVVQSLFGTAGKIAKPIVTKAGDWAEQYGLKSLGVNAPDINKSVRAKINTKLKLEEPQLVKQVQQAAEEGLIEPGQSAYERVLRLEDAKNTTFSALEDIAKKADTAGKKVWVYTQADFPNAYKYLEKFSPGSSEYNEVKEELSQRIKGIAKNIRESGTVSKILEEKRYLNNIGATAQQKTYIPTLQAALRTDLKELAERKIGQKLSSEDSKYFTELNKKYGDYSSLQNVYALKTGQDMAPELIVDKIIKNAATTGGAGVAILANKDMPGASELLMAPLLAAARSEKGASVIGEIFGKVNKSGNSIFGTAAKIKDKLPGISLGALTAQTLDQERVEPMDYTDNSSKNVVQEIFKNEEADVAKPDKTFIPRLKEVSKNLGIDHQDLKKVIGFETGGSFDSAQKNKAGSGATGLIQFMPATAKELLGAPTEAEAIKKLESMTPTEQLDYVEKHLKPYKNKIKDLDDLYMAVLYPRAVGKDSDYVLFREGTKAYAQNRGLDRDNDGLITKEDAAHKVRNYKV
jgi:hypothetical protein